MIVDVLRTAELPDSSATVRDQTAELASLALGDSAHGEHPENAPHIDFRPRRGSAHTFPASLYTIESEPSTPTSQSFAGYMERADEVHGVHERGEREHQDEPEPHTERDSLLSRSRAGSWAGMSRREERYGSISIPDDVEYQGVRRRGPFSVKKAVTWPVRRGRAAVHHVRNHKKFTKKELWEHGVKEPLRYLPAVILGLLLNVLDGLSYGKTPESPVLPSLMLTLHRHDSLPTRDRNIRKHGCRRALHFLCVVYRFAAGIFLRGKRFQGRNRLGNGSYSTV